MAATRRIADGRGSSKVDGDPRVQAAERLAAGLLRPAAERTDREGVPRSHLQALARAGLLGLSLPGNDAPVAVNRRVVELLAGADLSTWFVAAQHATPLRLLTEAARDSPARRRYQDALAHGRLLAGITFSHLRAHPRRPVEARNLPGGGAAFTGTAPWCTGWGRCDVLVLAGLTADDQVVYAIVPARDQRGLRASAPLQLAALGGTGTVTLQLDELLVPEDSVVTRLTWPEWDQADRASSANTNPAVFGHTAEVLRDLRGAGYPEAAAGFQRRLDVLRARAYQLVDEVPAMDRIPDRIALRAASLELATRAATTLVAAGGGRSMGTDARAQRLAREALFLLVQAQTRPVRQATIAQLAQLSPLP